MKQPIQCLLRVVAQLVAVMAVSQLLHQRVKLVKQITKLKKTPLQANAEPIAAIKLQVNAEPIAAIQLQVNAGLIVAIKLQANAEPIAAATLHKQMNKNRLPKKKNTIQTAKT